MGHLLIGLRGESKGLSLHGAANVLPSGHPAQSKMIDAGYSLSDHPRVMEFFALRLGR